MLEPYADMPQATGLVEDSPSIILKTAELALRDGYQVNTHAIGDRANREVLDAYEKAFAAHPEVRGDTLRWRIEHAQNIAPRDLPRFARLGVIASMQAIHCTSDGPWVPKRIGDERARTEAYLWRSLLDSGAVVTNGTDAPVEDMDPIPNFYAAVTRKMKNGEYFYPEQKMTRAEALKAYTLANAYAAFEEKEKGSLTPGKLADITVLSVDMMRVPVDEIPSAHVDYTILDGKVRYARAAAAGLHRAVLLAKLSGRAVDRHADDLHVERLSPPRYASADFPQPDNQQSAAIEHEEGLIAAHAGALAACEYETGHIVHLVMSIWLFGR